MGAYAGEARRRVHLATVFLRLRLAIAQADASERKTRTFVLLHKYRKCHTDSSSEFIALQARLIELNVGNMNHC